jgi:hypothetical protein
MANLRKYFKIHAIGTWLQQCNYIVVPARDVGHFTPASKGALRQFRDGNSGPSHSVAFAPAIAADSD